MNSPASNNLLFIIGGRGVGKTTVAKELSQALHWDWCDADAVLETRFGCSISTIFADEGEAGFREKETLVLKDLAERSQFVIATGGGVILREENRESLRQGYVIWLTASVETMAHRLRTDASTTQRRPSLTTVGSAGSVEEIAIVLASREKFYRECANCIVSTEQRKPEQIVEEILTQWKGRGA